MSGERSRIAVADEDGCDSVGEKWRDLAAEGFVGVRVALGEVAWEIEASSGFERVKIPDVDIIAGFVPLGFAPLDKGLCPLGLGGGGFALDQSSGGPDEESRLGELAHFLFQRVILQFVVGEGFVGGVDAACRGVRFDIGHGEAVLPEDQVEFGGEHFECGLGAEGFRPGVFDPDLPVIVGVVLPAIRGVFGEGLLANGVVGFVGGVVLIQMGLQPPVPDALPGGVVQQKHTGIAAEGELGFGFLDRAGHGFLLRSGAAIENPDCEQHCDHKNGNGT